MKKIPAWIMKTERYLGAWIMRGIAKTIRFEVQNQPPDGVICIISCWHRNILLMAMQRIGCGVAVVISSSQDGELIAGPVEELGFVTVRGSSRRGGANAYRQMLKMAKERPLGITPDGPKGPSQTVHPGVTRIAYVARIPIVATALDADKEWLFDSWDKLRLPKPFTRIRVLYGEPYYINNEEEMATADAVLKAKMDALEAELNAIPSVE
jgi:lysophospholipid acyltransferase (LPLAT)-like uncharacterized protein